MVAQLIRAYRLPFYLRRYVLLGAIGPVGIEVDFLLARGRTFLPSRQSQATRSGMTGARDCARWRSSKGSSVALSFTWTDRL